MGTIGKIAINLEAMHAQFGKSINQAGQDLKQLGSTASSVGNTIKGALAGIAVGVGVSAFKSMTSEVINSTVAAYRLSDSLGITTQSLIELQTAGLLSAGLSADEFSGSLQKMVKNLGGIGEDSDKAAGTLDKLGISAESLASMHTDEAFKTIAEAISKVKSPTDQAAAAIAIFGKSGQNLLPMLRGGAAGIEEAAAKARKFGIALSDVDAAKLVEAHEKFDEIGLAIDGAKDQLVVALAPALSEIAEHVLAILPAADQMREKFTNGLKSVALGVAYAMDTYQQLKTVILSVAYGGVGAFELLLMGIKKLADGIVWVTNTLFNTDLKTPEWITSTVDAVDTMRKSIGDDIKASFNSPSNVDSVNSFFDTVVKKSEDTAKAMADKKHDLAAPLAASFTEARKKIDDILTKLKTDVDTFGMSAGDKQVASLKALNATPEDFAKAKDLSAQLDAMEALKKLQEDANKLNEESLSPLQKYQESLAKINDMWQEGLLTREEHDASIAKANSTLQSSFKDITSVKRAGAETRRFDFDGPRDQQEVDPISVLTGEIKSQTLAVEQSKFYLSEIYRFQAGADKDKTSVIDF